MTSTALSPRAVTVPEAAKLLGCGRTKAFSLIKAGQLKARRLGGATVIALEDLDAFVRGLPDAREAPAPRGRAAAA